MGQIRKIGDEYYIEFYARGLMYQQKAGRDKAAAEKLLEETQRQIEQGELKTVVRDVDIDIFLHNFADQHKDQHPPPSWTHYEAAIGEFERFLIEDSPQTKKLSQVTPPVIERFRSTLTRKYKNTPETVNLNILLVRDIMEYGIKLGYINDNPTLHTRFVPIPASPKLELPSQDEVRHMMTRLTGGLKIVIPFLIATGLRVEEVINLTWGDIDDEQRCLIVPRACHGYTWKRSIPMTHEVLALLKKRGDEQRPVLEDLAGHRLKRGDLQQELQEFCSRNKSLPAISFEKCRHLFARDVLGRGAGLIKLYRLLGLDDILDVILYIDLLPEPMR